MKRGILCILLSIMMIVPLFTACSKESTKTETEVTIYTLYTITDESTTPEAIRQVELALNRILFYRLGIILDLQMVTADKYDEFIESKMAEVDEYKETGEYDVDPAYVSDVISGDDVLSMLMNDQDIVLKAPRVDIFLVQGYDKYYELATNEKLAAIDEKLMFEGKELTYSIHTTLFGAAKVAGKTYGIPVNSAIGEYTYFAYDKEFLDDSINPNSFKSLADLEGYLEIINTKYDGVVPMESVPESTKYNYLLNNGFPAIVDENGAIQNAYKNDDVVDYYSLIAKYQALGYLGNESDKDDTRYAVRMVTASSAEEAQQKLKDATGYDYTCYLYSNPIATNENTIDNIFCISSNVVSNDLTTVIKILTEINTDKALMNLLTFGVEGIHYNLTDNGTIERIDNIKHPYIMEPKHVGNCFITTILEGENEKKWEQQSDQNKDAIPSPSLGFTVTENTITYTDANRKSYVFTEPEYFSILKEVSDKYYSGLIDGTAISTKINFDEIKAKAEADADTALYENLKKYYKDHVVKPMIEKIIREKYDTPEMEKLIKDKIRDDLNEEFSKDVKKRLKSELEDKFEAENPDATSEDIDAMVNAVLTDEYISENMSRWYTEEYIEEEVEKAFPADKKREVDKELKAISELAEKEDKEVEDDSEVEDTTTEEDTPEEPEDNDDTVVLTPYQQFEKAAKDVEAEIEKFVKLSIDAYNLLTNEEINVYAELINDLEASVTDDYEFEASDIEKALKKVNAIRTIFEEDKVLKDNAVLFKNTLAEKLVSDEFNNKLEESKKYNKASIVNKAIDAEISKAVDEYVQEMFIEMDAAVKAAVEEFVAKCADEAGVPIEAIQEYILTAIGFTESSTDAPADDNTTDEGATDEGTTDEDTTDEGTTDEGTTDEGATDEDTTDEGTNDEGATDEDTTDEEVEEAIETPWFDFALTKKIANSYYAICGQPITAA